MNRKGQFSIIAALLVAVVLIAATMAAYSAIRYNPVQEQPQILSATDETNLGLKEILGFTVGYYGSVLKVTGNQTYAQQLARNYLQSGLDQIVDVRPEWGTSVSLTDLDLKTQWFSNQSYSQGNMTVNYNLNGLGISGATYSTSTRLDVQILKANSTSQAYLKILMDEDQPLINLGKSNLQFCRYNNQSSAWELVQPTNIASYIDGTYVIDLPDGVLGGSYVIQVQDTRGLMVLASSFSYYTSTLTWNTTSFQPGLDYVDTANLDVTGTHSNFTAQQYGPDSVYDTLTEAANGTTYQPSYPTSYSLFGTTTYASGAFSDMQTNNGTYMSFHSYPSGFSGSATLGYSTIGSSSSQSSIEDTIRGSLFNMPVYGQVQNISVYLDLSNAVNRKVKTAIYSESNDFIASTEEKTISSTGWYTFNFADPKPVLAANTNYILVAWSDYASGSVSLRYDTGVSDQGHYRSNQNYGDWPTSVNFNHNNNKYSIYCGYNIISQYSAQVELTGSSVTPFPWNTLLWTIDSSVSTSNVTATFQLFNATAGQFPTSGDGYMWTTLDSTTGDTTKQQMISISPTSFLNASGYWKVMVTAVKSTSSAFDLNLDWVQYSPNATNYALNLQEQWLSVNASNIRQDLCIKTGTMSGAEPLTVQVWHGGSWQDLMTLVPNYFNNVSLAPYIDSSNLTIQFVGSNDDTDPTQDSWNIDSVYLQDEPDISFLLNLQESTFTLEVLQNGTMRWLGQNMQLTTQTLPIPPVPVKAIHVNETINGVNQGVPFQIEDWASNYQIPLGLTSNTMVFSNRQMIVFQLNSSVTDFTIWWDGSDTATQTPLAYTNNCFHDSATSLNNGKITLTPSTDSAFTITSQVNGKTTSSTTTFMRVNTEASTYGAGSAYVICNGTVRDIIQQEAEWGKTNPPTDDGGAHGCPNLYASIVLTLPAGVSYYTYQLRFMFINSTQVRTINDTCPIKVATTLSPVQAQTENGTLAGFPLLQNGTGTFSNYASGGWTAHHFSQFITDNGKGAGIMFTDMANQKLYAFDSFSGSSSKGALKASSGLLELLPVSSGQVQFQTAYDITWRGAVATFDGTTPVCNLYDGTTPMGLWILAEYPPTVAVTAKS